MTSELDRLMQRVALGVAVLTLAGMGYGELSYGGPTGDVPDAGELAGWPVLPPYEDHITDTVYAPGGGIMACTKAIESSNLSTACMRISACSIGNSCPTNMAICISRSSSPIM